MKVKKFNTKEVKKLFTTGGETKDSFIKVIREFLTVGIAVPFLSWAYLMIKISGNIIGNVALFDVLLVIYTGVCIYKKYIKRDKTETIKSRLSCIVASIVKLFWIGIGYIWLTSVAIKGIGLLIQIPVITLISAIGVKSAMLFIIKNHIEPDKQIILKYEEEFDLFEDDAEDESIA